MDKEIELLIENNKELYNLEKNFISNIFRKCSALTLTMRNKKVDVKKLNEAIKIIKDNTSMFSRLRGNNLLAVATTISLEEDMEKSLLEINSIYEELKNEFLTTQYLALAAMAIYNKERNNVKETVKKAREVYDYMKKNHKFLTSSEDVTAAAMIAITSENIEKTMDNVERYYKSLSERGYRKGDSLQSLSHILTLFNENIEENVDKVCLMDKALRENSIKFRSFSLPVLGVASVITENFDVFAKNVKEASERLKKEKGFGVFSLDTNIRNMIAMSIVLTSYFEDLSKEKRDEIISTTNNIALTIQIAMEIATTTAITAAVAASSASSSS